MLLESTEPVCAFNHFSKNYSTHIWISLETYRQGIIQIFGREHSLYQIIVQVVRSEVSKLNIWAEFFFTTSILLCIISLVVQLVDSTDFRIKETVKTIQRWRTIIDGLIVDVLIAIYQGMEILLLLQIKMRIKDDRNYRIAVGVHTASHKHRDTFHHTNACSSNAKNEYFFHIWR